MKKILLYFLLIFFVAVGCKKDMVDASSSKNFQESINDMISNLNTLQQDKFNEALYILKTFGVEGNSDLEKMKNLGHLLNGKKVPEIMALADKIAKEKEIEWSSTAPPSLGTMNIFSTNTPTETDYNDIKASALKIIITPTDKDSLFGINSMMIIPHLVNGDGTFVEFSNATLETIMEVFSNGNKIYTSTNLMQDHHFKGFPLKVSSLLSSKVWDNTIDIAVSVKTTKKTYKMTKTGIKINPNALQKLKKNNEDELMIEDSITIAKEYHTSVSEGNPKSVVRSFLNHLALQNFKGAYGKTNNPNWESYEVFSNSTTGFGTVKNISVKNITTTSSSLDNASVNTSYEVQDKDGNRTSLNVTFGLKNTDGEWKIISYKIN